MRREKKTGHPEIEWIKNGKLNCGPVVQSARLLLAAVTLGAQHLTCQVSRMADGLHGLPKGLRAEAAPVAVPFADPDKFSHYVGLSAARARKLHRTEGFPLRARGKGARRSYYVVLSEVEAWWKKQNGE